VRHLAWLQAIPEGSKKSRLASFKEASDDDSSFLEFPDIDDAEYMIPLLHEAGLMSSNGMGLVPLSWQEIESWLQTTELELSVWEKLTIKEMSEAYVAEFNKATARDASAPYVPYVEAEDIDRPAVANKLLTVLRGFKRSPTEGAQT